MPFTRAGCNVGDVATVNQGPREHRGGHPEGLRRRLAEAQQLAADTDSFKDAETADYVGIAVHCAQQSAFCATAKGVKYGQTTATPTAVSDLLPDEPGGYTATRRCSATGMSRRSSARAPRT